MPSAGAEQDLQAAIAEVWQRVKGSVEARVSTLEDAVGALLLGDLTPEQRRSAEREAHKLAGSLGTFGLSRGSELARELEYALGADAELSQAQAPRLAELVLALRHELDRDAAAAADPGAPEPAVAAGRPSLLLVDHDPELADRLAAQAATRGIRTTAAATPSAARALIAEALPDAVLLELGDADQEALDLLSELGDGVNAVPTLVLTASEALVDRVEAARRGGRGFLARTSPPARVVDAVAAQLEARTAVGARLLAVDDDPGILAALGTLLASADVAVITLDDPLAFWETLEQTAPEIVVLDVDMPRLDGIELCRTLRTDPRFAELPVLFLTARSDAASVQRMFEAGADDYVRKPIVAAELVTRVRNRLDRVRVYRRLIDTDALTGVATRGRSEQGLERILRMAARFEQPLSMAVLDLDHFKRLNDRLGHAAGDAILRRLGGLLLEMFRGEDVVARWGGEEFVVGMYGMPRVDAVQRLAEVLERFRREAAPSGVALPGGSTFSAGVAQFPDDGADLHALYLAADAALYQAKAAGRDRVVPVGFRGEEAERGPDVVVVEDDPDLAALLVHALRTRSQVVEHIADGQQAAEVLAGGVPRLAPPLLVLDVDLPGLDGLSLLRRLAGAGALERPRVIMLTARAAEAEVLEALELGAFDHVAKPFSVPVLMERIRRAQRP